MLTPELRQGSLQCLISRLTGFSSILQSAITFQICAWLLWWDYLDSFTFVLKNGEV